MHKNNTSAFIFILILAIIIFINGCSGKIIKDNDKVEVGNEVENFSDNIIKIDEDIIPDMEDGFLLSIRKDTKSVFYEDEGADYRTFWVYEKDGKINSLQIKDKVLVPIDGEFYVIKNDNMKLEKLLDNSLKNKTQYTNFDYSYKKRFNNLIIDNLEEEEKHLYTKEEADKMVTDSKWPIENVNEKILYVDENYIGIEGNRYRSDNSQNIKDYYVKIFSTIDLNKREEILISDEIKIDKQYKLTKKELEKQYNNKITQEENNGKIVFSNLDKVDNNVIALIRKEGKGTLAIPIINEKINYNNDTYTVTSKEYIPFTVDESYGIEFNDNENYIFDKIKNIFPNAKDALISSTGKINVIVEENNIYFFEDDKLEEKKAFFSIDLAQNEQVIMTMSISGDGKKKWNEILNRYVKMEVETLDVRVTPQNINNKEDGVYNVDIKMPHIELNDKGIEKKINNYLRDDFQSIEDGLIKIAKIDKNNMGLDFKGYYLYLDYKANVVNDNILSLQVPIKEYAGTDYELQYLNSYNIDLSTGERIELEDLFNEGYIYSEIIKKEILEQISNSIDEKLYSKDIIQNTEVFERYYFTDDNQLVIYFGQNEVAPLKEGICKFFIPIDVFGDNIKIK
ncbi:DUF3298 and DUF4163 domain-containing protein [Clostridium sp. DL1XJH146]